jgi:hypothetical protein
MRRPTTRPTPRHPEKPPTPLAHMRLRLHRFGTESVQTHPLVDRFGEKKGGWGGGRARGVRWEDRTMRERAPLRFAAAVVALTSAVACGHSRSSDATGTTSPGDVLRAGVTGIARGDYDLLYGFLDPRQKALFSPAAIQCPYFGVFDPTVWAEHNPGAVPVVPHNLSPTGDVEELTTDLTGLGKQPAWNLNYAGDYHLALLATKYQGTYWLAIDSSLGSECHPDK